MCWSVWVERFQTTWLRAMTIHRFIESPPHPPYPFVFTLLLFSASCIAKCLITPDFTRTERRQWIASRTMPRQGNITKIVKQHNDRLPGQRREAFIEGVPIFVQNLIAAPARLLLNVGEYRCPHGINFFTPFMNYLTTPFSLLNLFGKIVRSFWVREKIYISALVHVLTTTVCDQKSERVDVKKKDGKKRRRSSSVKNSVR